MRHLLVSAAIAAAALASASPAGAQQDFTIPDAPAFTYLGVSPAKVSRPSTPRDLAFGLADGIDSLGRVQRGLAVDFVPWLIFPARVTARDYRSSWAKFAYANLSASLGSVRPAGDSAATDLALGLKTNFANGADPLVDAQLGVKIDAAVQQCQDIKDASGRPIPTQIEDCSSKATEKLVQEWLDAGHWNDFALGIAAAFGARLAESEIDRFHGRGGALWATMGLPLGAGSGQLLLQARGDWTRGGAAKDTTALATAGRLLFGGASYNVFAEMSGSWRSAGENKRVTDWSGGVEYRAAEDLWLSTGFGTAYNERVKGDRVVLIANLRWNVSGESRLVTR